MTDEEIQKLIDIAKNGVKGVDIKPGRNTIQQFIDQHDIEAGKHPVPTKIIYLKFYRWFTSTKDERKIRNYISFTKYFGKQMLLRGIKKKGLCYYLNPEGFDLKGIDEAESVIRRVSDRERKEKEKKKAIPRIIETTKQSDE